MTSVAHIVRRRRRRASRKASRKQSQRLWTIIFGSLFVVLIAIPASIALGSALSLYLQVSATLPEPNTPIHRDAQAVVTEFYDVQDVRLLHRLQDPFAEGRPWISIDTLPSYVIQATLDSEDPDFLTTTRFNIGESLFQLWRYLLIGGVGPDNSITGRLVRGAIAPALQNSGDYSATSMGREIVMISELNRRYTPTQILEWHLNTNYYGTEAYGIEAAAQLYFNKRAVDLTLAEAAMLAAITTSPEYNPLDNEVAARGRQRDLLRLMLSRNMITEGQFNEATADEIPITPNTQYLANIAPEFMTYSRRQAENILNALGYDGEWLVARGGLRITTTLDVDLYLQAECIARAHLASLSNQSITDILTLDETPCVGTAYLQQREFVALDDSTAPNSSAIIILDAQTGEIKVMVGRANDATYQPGMTLAPFVYLEGFNGGLGGLFTPATMVLDIPLQFPGSNEGLIYTIANPDERFRGPMNLRDAMGAGLYPPAATVTYRQGVSTVLRTAHQLGLNTLDENAYNLSILERGGNVSVLDLAYAYSVFATLGDMRGVNIDPVAFGYRGRDPVAVRSITDVNGQVLWTYDPADAAICQSLTFCTPLLEDGLAYLVNDVLADQETRWPLLGENNILDLDHPAAVVNSLTSDVIDNWTLGYTTQLVTGVHVGRQDRMSMGLSPFGVEGAAPVWRAIMDYAQSRDQLPLENWQRPSNVIEGAVCDRSGLAPNDVCPVHTELFMEGTQSLPRDTYWQLVEINNQTGQLATANTPAGLRSQVRYFVPPTEAREWWVANNQPLPPEDIDTMSLSQSITSVDLQSPIAYSYVGGEVEIRGQINTPDLREYQLSYGQGLNPSSWINIGEAQTTVRTDDLLGVWDTRNLDGLYSIRLVATRQDNSVESDLIQVTVDNVAPTITLNSVEPGKLYRFPGDENVQIQADVNDNLAIERVEFFHNSEFLGADPSWPYSFEWAIRGPGVETFTAIAYDAVGNSAQVELVVQIVRDGS